MMYANSLAVAIKANGKVLREVNHDTVYLPFGCEYTLLIKNLHNVRVIVYPHIDGQDVTDGAGLVIDPKREVELTRFIRNGNLTAGNRFKFIERTTSIEDHRGIKLEDGLVRIEYQFESVYQPPKLISTNNQPTSTWPDKQFGMFRGINTNAVVGAASASSVTLNCVNTSTQATASSDVGITVPGSVSTQQFTTASWFPVEHVKHNLIIKLRGEASGSPVSQPITVNTKVECPTCGQMNKPTMKFCPNCGASVQLV